MSRTEPGSIFETASAVLSAIPAQARVNSKPTVLSSAALAVAAQRSMRAYSQIVLDGRVRLIEVALVALIGLVVYSWYVVPVAGFAWRYAGAIAGISLLSLLAFQAA